MNELIYHPGKIQRNSTQSVRCAAHWLLYSGIQHLTSNEKLKGGVACWYELGQKQYPFLYSEITGYALSALCFLFRIYREQIFLQRAVLAVSWLIQNALHSNGGIRTRLYLVKDYVSPNYCFNYERIYAFDTSMVGYGLVQFYQKQPSKLVGDAIEKIAHFLITQMRRADGSFHPYYDAKTGRCDEDLDKWSDQRGTFHAKCALFFTDLYKSTRTELYRKVAFGLLESAVEEQLADGRFVTGRKDCSTHLHPHAYTLEGLLYGGIYFKKNHFIEAALRGFQWALNGVSVDGSVSSYYVDRRFSFHERSDIVAQLLRIGTILYSLKANKMRPYMEILSRIGKHLLLFQYHADKRQKGGFIYGAATDGLVRDHLNAWGTMFAMQALWMYDRCVKKKKKLVMDHFI